MLFWTINIRIINNLNIIAGTRWMCSPSISSNQYQWVEITLSPSLPSPFYRSTDSTLTRYRFVIFWRNSPMIQITFSKIFEMLWLVFISVDSWGDFSHEFGRTTASARAIPPTERNWVRIESLFPPSDSKRLSFSSSFIQLAVHLLALRATFSIWDTTVLLR